MKEATNQTIMKAKQNNTNLKVTLLDECHAMIKFLSANGKAIPPLACTILNTNMNDLTEVEISNEEVLSLHKELSKKIAPARPKSIWLLQTQSEKKGIFYFLGPVVLVKRLMIVAVFSLVLFVTLSLSKEINDDNISYTIFEKSGRVLFVVLTFYLTSASLGAAFSNLFQANRYILNNTFDPKYEASYWIRFVLGIIAGFLLAVMIPLPDGIADSTQTTNIEVLSRPLLAMLGGFSASLVYRILFRLVYAVESIFIGKPDEQKDHKMANMQASTELEKENERQNMVNQLLTLQGQVNQGKTGKELSEEIGKTISVISS